MKEIKIGCPCIVDIKGTKGCALATSRHSPTARSESPTKAQPCVPLISSMHGQLFLILLTSSNQLWSAQFILFAISPEIQMTIINEFFACDERFRGHRFR